MQENERKALNMLLAQRDELDDTLTHLANWASSVITAWSLQQEAFKEGDLDKAHECTLNLDKQLGEVPLSAYTCCDQGSLFDNEAFAKAVAFMTERVKKNS